MRRPNLSFWLIPPGILAFCLMAVYLFSMAKGLTWANAGTDGGDLITAAATGGIAHPTGYPLYLLLARLFQFLPIGSLAFRTNLMSAFAADSAAVFIYGIVIQAGSSLHARQKWIAGVSAGFAFGLAPLVWSQAVITEVYTLHSFFVALLLYLLVKPLSGGFTKKRQDCLLGLVFGLAMGNHITTILLLPLLILSVFQPKQGNPRGVPWIMRWYLEVGSLLRRIGWGMVGLLVYIILPLRALSHPPVNWGYPATLNGFLWLISGRLYQGLVFRLDFISFLERVQTVIALLLMQFGVIGLIIGLIGLIVFYKPTFLNFCLLWISIVSVAFAIGYGTTDATMYTIPAFLCFSVWIGKGVGDLMDALSRKYLNIAQYIGFLFIFILLIQGWMHFPQVDASHDSRAEAFGRSVVILAPSRAIVFAKGDEAIFTMWYFQYALHNRPDLAIVATDLLGFNWYLQNLKSTYPDLIVPGPLPFAETLVLANPERPICYIQYVQAAEINCLPADNSPAH